MTVHVSIPLDEDQAARLDAIATARQETTEDVLAEAVSNYLQYDDWFVGKVKKGIASARNGEVLDFDEVANSLRSRMRAGEPRE